MSSPYGNRTRVSAVRGRRLNRLTNEPFITIAYDFYNCKCFFYFFIITYQVYKNMRYFYSDCAYTRQERLRPLTFVRRHIGETHSSYYISVSPLGRTKVVKYLMFFFTVSDPTVVNLSPKPLIYQGFRAIFLC